MSALSYSWRHLIVGDVKFYATKHRWAAMVRSVAWRVVGWDAETCQTCGRNYSWSNWVASSELYERVHGNRRGTLCPRHFSEEAKTKGIHICWTPIEETDLETHGRIMDGELLFSALSGAAEEG